MTIPRFYSPRICLRLDDEEDNASAYQIEDVWNGAEQQGNMTLAAKLDQLDRTRASLIHIGRDGKDVPQGKSRFAFLSAPLREEAQDQDPSTYVAELQGLLNERTINHEKNYLNGKQNLSLATLNWYIRGASDTSGMPIGGPGAAPKPASAPSISNAGVDTSGEGAHVYVLDTLPWQTGNTDDEARVKKQIENHPTLKDWWKNVEIVKMSDILNPNSPVNLGNVVDSNALSEFVDAGKTDGLDPYPNHGLFITDLIHQLAPKAQITLVESMNQYVMGSVQGYCALMHWLRHVIANDEAERIYVNMSFTWDIPAFGHDFEDAVQKLIEGGFPSCQEWKDAIVQYAEMLKNLRALEKDGYEDNICSMIVDLMDMVNTKGNVTFLAASGNNSSGNKNRRVARYPARADGVIGVGAAASLGGTIYADYSNLSDDPPSVGHLEWGGDRTLTGSKFESSQGLIGAYIGGNFGNAAPTGYVEWSGTSFATARKTGLMAK